MPTGDDRINSKLMHKMALETNDCPVCGCVLDYDATGDRRRYASIDRIDPRLGYSVDNVMIMCSDCNRRKGVCTIDDLCRLLLALVLRRKL